MDRSKSRNMGSGLRAGDRAVLSTLETALHEAGGDVSRAARALGIPHRTLQYWQEAIPAVRALIAQVRADVAVKLAAAMTERASGTGERDTKPENSA